MNVIFLVVVCLLEICLQAASKTANKQNPKCGRPIGSNFITQSERIVSGYDVGYYRYSWYAALMRNRQVECGGALIGPRLVVTAAHCYKEYLHTDTNNSTGIKLEPIYTVRLGMYNVCTTENTTVDFKVEKVQVHELYMSKQPYFDICLLTLANSTENFEPICLPSGVVNPRPREGSVPGMGTLRYQGPMPCTLHEARLLVYPDSACVKMMDDSGNNGSAIVNVFCAGYLSGGIDTCQGDSGGPFQILDSKGRYTLLGIVSFGFHCAVPNYLGVYTDVSRYIKWIKQKGGLDDIQLLHSLGDNSSDENSSNEDDNKPNVPDHENNKTHPNGNPHNRPITIIILRDGKSAKVHNRHGRHGEKHRKN